MKMWQIAARQKIAVFGMIFAIIIGLACANPGTARLSEEVHGFFRGNH